MHSNFFVTLPRVLHAARDFPTIFKASPRSPALSRGLQSHCDKLTRIV
jgi:hypothetical protein